MKEIVDLHTHTTFSDGTYTPGELVAYAGEKGLLAIAITDHDTIDGVKALGKTNGMPEVIPGIEISADYNDNEIHIVGLYIDTENEELNKKLQQIVENRNKRNAAIINKLNCMGIPITLEALERIRGDKSSRPNAIISRSHFAKWLCDNGYSKDYKDSFKVYLDKNKSAFVKRELPSFSEAIEMIRSAGGIAILAHPLLYKMSGSELEKMAFELRKSGMTGIECFYPTHSEKDTAFILSLCEKTGLKPSGGSDFHGANKPNLDLAVGYGNLSVEKKILDDLKEGITE